MSRGITWPDLTEPNMETDYIEVTWWGARGDRMQLMACLSLCTTHQRSYREKLVEYDSTVVEGRLW